MGLTKEYLRYISDGNFNIIASSDCNVDFVTLEGQEGRFVAAGACEHIIIWDLRLGQKAQVLSGESSPVTSIRASPNNKHLAGGYSDGNVQVYDLRTAEITVTFYGHRSRITALAFDNEGHKLASGSQDTDVIIWDVVAENGLYRLSGHKGPITQICFMQHSPILITGSRDKFVKFWDLDTQHCFKTLADHRTEISGLCLAKDDQYLITGCGDAELRVWKLTDRQLTDDQKDPVKYLTAALEIDAGDGNEDLNLPIQCNKVGTLLRAGRGRVVSMCCDKSGQMIGCHGTDNQIEFFYLCTDDEAQTRLKKRLKKERKKEKEEPSENSESAEVVQPEPVLTLTLRDQIKRLSIAKTSDKPKSIAVIAGGCGEIRIVSALSNNSLVLFSLDSKSTADAKMLREVLQQGHRTEIRALCFSSDNMAIVSASGDAVKLWNRNSLACARTVPTGYVLCCTFVPGDRHVLAGMKDGSLLIIDIASGDILETIPAHKAELWSLCLHEQKGCVTGGGDKTVKFWQFELVVDESSETNTRVLSLLHSRTLTLEECVLCVKISPNNKFIAVALLDCTVKIFFVDTFKFYLSLYGHSLPVCCMDISSDSALIATGSGDRNLKIWGMDFGDCHRSIFAHDTAVTGVQFVPDTHYIFSTGGDGRVKQWDGDRFNKIITLQGHSGEALALAVSPNAKYVVSSGRDRVIRLYSKSDQPLVLEDEEEEERARAAEEEERKTGAPDPKLPTRKTVGSERGAESILECLQVAKEYAQELNEHENRKGDGLPNVPLLMRALGVNTVEDFLLETVRRIRASDLEESLLLLPFDAVREILALLPALLDKGEDIELISKVAIFLLKLHQSQIVANHSLINVLDKLQKCSFDRVQNLRDVVGRNLYGMKAMHRELESIEGVQLFRDQTFERKKNEKKRKQKENLKRAIMVLNS